MRKMKSPPLGWCLERANAQGYRAERMLPKWIKPVGDGAKRVRTRVVMGSKSLHQMNMGSQGSHPRSKRACSHAVETTGQVGLDVGHVLQAHSHTHQALADPSGLPLGL